MNTFVRNPTSGWRMFSRRGSCRNQGMTMSSYSYRRDRARKRQIFLQTYKLGADNSSGDKFRTQKLKKVAVKAKSVVLSCLSFMRAGAFKSCNSRQAICASSPARVTKYC